MGRVSADSEQPVAKKIAIASGAVNYNILQNNGRIAHQEVDHVSAPASVVWTGRASVANSTAYRFTST